MVRLICLSSPPPTTSFPFYCTMSVFYSKLLWSATYFLSPSFLILFLTPWLMGAEGIELIQCLLTIFLYLRAPPPTTTTTIAVILHPLPPSSCSFHSTSFSSGCRLMKVLRCPSNPAGCTSLNLSVGQNLTAVEPDQPSLRLVSVLSH